MQSPEAVALRMMVGLEAMGDPEHPRFSMNRREVNCVLKHVGTMILAVRKNG
jgi:hypothetical protein